MSADVHPKMRLRSLTVGHWWHSGLLLIWAAAATAAAAGALAVSTGDELTQLAILADGSAVPSGGVVGSSQDLECRPTDDTAQTKWSLNGGQQFSQWPPPGQGSLALQSGDKLECFGVLTGGAAVTYAFVYVDDNYYELSNKTGTVESHRFGHTFVDLDSQFSHW